MQEINLLAKLPRGKKRDVNARATAKSDEVIRISREYGYGGYRYDGRWIPVAEDMVKHFGLKPGDRVLDVGCAKGFLVKDFMKACPGVEAFGLDISRYALMNCEPEVVGRLHLGNAMDLPFPDNSFKAVISLNTVHNLDRDQCIVALKEIQRVSGGRAYVQVDSYRTPEERQRFLDWVLTAHYHEYPEGWINTFKEAGYTGDYNWTIVE